MPLLGAMQKAGKCQDFLQLEQMGTQFEGMMAAKADGTVEGVREIKPASRDCMICEE